MRVAIEAAGVVTPIGWDLSSFVHGMYENLRGFSCIPFGPLPREKDRFAFVEWRDANGPKTSLGLVRQCISEISQSFDGALVGDRTAVIVGTVWGDTQILEDSYDALMCQSPNSGSDAKLRQAFRSYPIGYIAETIAEEIGATGPILTVSNAGASGNVAMGLGHDLIESGSIDTAVCIGVDRFSLTGLWGAERSGFVGRKAQPFDKDRSGAVLGEGAGAIVLARADKEAALGWMEGWDVYCEPGAAAITLRDDGLGLKRAMANACAMAGRDATEYGHVSAHAPGTPLIDKIETAAIADIFGPDGPWPYINALKSLTGHMSGASAVVEAVASLLQMRAGLLRGNAALEHADPELALPVLPAEPLAADIALSLSNACGGGGLNSTVALAAPHVAPANDKMAKPRDAVQAVITGRGSLQAGTVAASQASEPWFSVETWFARETQVSYMNRSGQLGAIAGKLALSEAGISPVGPEADHYTEAAVVSGAWLGGWPQASAALCHGLTCDPVEIFPSTALDNGCHLGAIIIAREYALIGPTTTFCGHLNSGAAAILRGAEILRLGRQDRAVVMAYDTHPSFLGQIAGAVGHPPHLKSFVDGAASLVMESAQSAEARGAQVLAALDGGAHCGMRFHTDAEAKSAATSFAGRLGGGADHLVHASWPDERMNTFAQTLAATLGSRLETCSDPHSAAAQPAIALTRRGGLCAGRTIVLTGTCTGPKTAIIVDA